MKNKKLLKKALPLAIVAGLVGGAATWYLIGREKRLKDTRDIDFQKVTV